MLIPRFLLEDGDIARLEKYCGGVRCNESWLTLTGRDMEGLFSLMRKDNSLNEKIEEKIFLIEMSAKISELYEKIETVSDEASVYSLVASMRVFDERFPRQMFHLLRNK